MNLRSLFVIVVASAAIAAFAGPDSGTTPVGKSFPAVGPLPKIPSTPASPAAIVMVLGVAAQAVRKRFSK